MRPSLFSLSTLWLACGLTSIQAAEAELPVPPRFSPALMDLTADPRVDFSRYAYGNWLKQNSIPADKASWGGFGELAIGEVFETAGNTPQSVAFQFGGFLFHPQNELGRPAANIDDQATLIGLG